jgi:putative DNA primase/helicase
MDSTFFKQLVSGEPVEARLPYKDPYLMSDYAKLVFNTNILPKDIENNEAFFRRFTLIPFNVTIPEEERDPALSQRIIENELAGVFNWVLSGLGRLLKNKGLTPSDTIDRTLKEFRQQSDTVYLFLDEENFAPDNMKEKSLADLFSRYNEYCKSCNYKACSRRTFSERIRMLGYSVVRRSHGNMVGISRKDT